MPVFDFKPGDIIFERRQNTLNHHVIHFFQGFFLPQNNNDVVHVMICLENGIADTTYATGYRIRTFGEIKQGHFTVFRPRDPQLALDAARYCSKQQSNFKMRPYTFFAAVGSLFSSPTDNQLISTEASCTEPAICTTIICDIYSEFLKSLFQFTSNLTPASLYRHMEVNANNEFKRIDMSPDSSCRDLDALKLVHGT